MTFNKEQKQYFNEILDVLDEAGASDHVTLIGSWAEYIYEENNILENFTSFAKTTDIDFLLRNLRQPNPPTDIVKYASEKGFLYKEDYMSGVSKLHKEDFEVEFLICQKGEGTKILPRSNIGIKAQQITHMDFINNHTIKTEWNGHTINIPEPEAYVLQKMIINDRRKHKAELDRQKIDNMLPHINKEKFKEIYEGLYKKEQKAVDKYINQYNKEFLLTKNETQNRKNIINGYKILQNNPGVYKDKQTARKAFGDGKPKTTNQNNQNKENLIL